MHERIAALPGPPSTDEVARLKALGFDTVLVIDAQSSAWPAASSATSTGLAVWATVIPDEAGLPLFRPYATDPIAPWLVDDEAALDPRRPPHRRRAAPARDTAALRDEWATRLAQAVAHGVSGFVCRDVDRLPPAFWSALIATARDWPVPPRWTAWTPGLAAGEVDAIAAAGFDLVTSSLAWWDGRAAWLSDECEGGRPAGRLAFPDDPFEPRAEDAMSFSPRALLKLAAFVGDALLVPHAIWSRDVAIECKAVNRWFARRATSSARLRTISGPGAATTALVRTPTFDVRASDDASIALVNPDAKVPVVLAASGVTTALSGFGKYEEALADDGVPAIVFDACAEPALAPASVRLFDAKRLAPVRLAQRSSRRSAEAGIEMPRLAIEAVTPSVDGGRFPVKRTAGEAVRVEADILIDGHEKLAAALLYRAVGDRDWQEIRMEPVVNDRYAATFPLSRVGRHEFTIEAWRDVFASYRNELDKKFAAGLDVSLELIEGRHIVDDALANVRSNKRGELVRRLTILSETVATDVAGDRESMAAQVAALLGSQTLADMQAADRRSFATRPDAPFPIDAERGIASFASWYELFPRSLGNPPGHEPSRHGTFADVIDRLPAVRDMGFDVLYFPPINPIGKTNRKGRNNSLVVQEGEPGSPYAIGSEDGGHDAIHPELGTFEDFQKLRDAALEHGLELALDFAIQCSPDHPWLQQHPGWFAWRPDGSMRYAENPPKKYEDIVNVEFYGDAKGDDAAKELWIALRDVILSWVDQGVKIFRVDNPHTKPLPFWEWMIGEVRAKHPDVIFLSEAFTRPKLMYRLAKVGFSQSYTYFTWRHTKDEFVQYLTELTTTAQGSSSPKDFFRPNFFVNTPDINPLFLQRSGRPGFLIRAALAATLSGLWGVYSGFELCEATPVPGKEDYYDSEKYQLRAWDWQRPGNIIGEITQLNRIRRQNPSLQTHLNVRFQNVFDPNILYFAKQTADRSNIVLVAINLDPHGVHEADFELPLWTWGRDDGATVDATDLLDGRRFQWHGKTQRMRLDPGFNPYAIWRVTL